MTLENGAPKQGTDADKTVALFDLDGTLSAARKQVDDKMVEVLKRLRKVAIVGIVSGSDASKVNWQLRSLENEVCDFLFYENGLVAYSNGTLLGSQSLSEYLGEFRLKQLVNFVLRYFADLDIPKKRGTFIEYRTGLINFCPIGRNCSYEERLEFAAYDKEHGVRRRFIAALEKEFPDYGIQFAAGGQISVDCFPIGWDKTYCLRYLEDYRSIHFFGDATEKGGNDHEIFCHSRTIGHTVKSPEETQQIIRELFRV